jgi:AbrB family looped-hinge helix DNA binding protein
MKEQREYTMTLTRKGQVTIPVEIRRLLGVEPYKQVTFQVEEGEVRLRPAQATLEAAYGAVKPLSQPEDFEKLTEIAQEDHALEASKH